jgi:SAM-dependent methyltransferase
MRPLKLYEELAVWWPLFSPPEEYADEAAYFIQILQVTRSPPPNTIVEFGSGAGGNAYYLKDHFAMTLVDLAPDMLNVSRELNPECEHLVGDMRSVRLERRFDAVFVHDAIMYMTTEEDLRRAIETAFVHLEPGGVALLVPDCVRETFEPLTEHGGRDGDGRSLRYLEWDFDPDPTDTTYTVHFALLLRVGDDVRVEHDRHTEGLFARSDWLRLLREAGFQPETVTDPYGRDVFIALKPEA